MSARRITPSFVAGFVGGAVLACLVTWGMAAWSLSHDRQQFAQAFALQQRCTGGSDDYRRAATALTVVETCDREGLEAVREQSLRSARHHAKLLSFHQGEHPTATAELEARLARAEGLPYDETLIPVELR